MLTHSLILLTAAFFVAGILGTIAGGASFITFPALLITGLDPRAANITSTIALFPNQVSSGFLGRKTAGSTPRLSFKALMIISLIGGIIGAVLLLMTPPSFFALLVPWLILLATVVFAYGNFRKKDLHKNPHPTISKAGLILIQLSISIYGGYFGGGIGFLMLAALTLSGMDIRVAGTTKNILAAAMNASAVAIFLFSHDIGWIQASVGAAASICGGLVGIRLLHKLNEGILRVLITTIGATLSAFMLYKAYWP